MTTWRRPGRSVPSSPAATDREDDAVRSAVAATAVLLTAVSLTTTGCGLLQNDPHVPKEVNLEVSGGPVSSIAYTTAKDKGGVATTTLTDPAPATPWKQVILAYRGPMSLTVSVPKGSVATCRILRHRKQLSQVTGQPGAP